MQGLGGRGTKRMTDRFQICKRGDSLKYRRRKLGVGKYNKLNCRYSEFEMFVVHQIGDVYWGP